MITLGENTYISRSLLKAGHVIKFSYKGKPRVGVVVTSNWNNNCDCYEFYREEDIPEDMLMLSLGYIDDGELFHHYKNEFEFKSFKLSKMRSLQKIEVKFEEEELIDASTSPVIDQVIENIFDPTTEMGLYGE